MTDSNSDSNNSQTDQFDQLSERVNIDICEMIETENPTIDNETKDNILNGVSLIVGQYTSDVEDLHDLKTREIIKEFKNYNDEHQLVIANHQKIIDKYLSELDRSKSHRKRANEAISDVLVVRSYLNQKFDQLACQQSLPNQDDNEWLRLAKQIPSLKRPERVKSNRGLQLAVSVLTGQSNGPSQELCLFYIKINDSHHPKVQPAKTIVVKSLDSLIETIKMKSLPNNYEKMGINEVNLNLVKKLLT